MRLLNRRRVQRVASAVITDPEDYTVMNAEGAVRSVQAANVDLPAEQLEAIWTPTHLERLARTYWKFLSRVTLGLIRVHYSDEERAVVFIGRPFVLLRFHPPDYEMTPTRGVVRWRIRDGILVHARDQGFLEIDVRRCDSDRPGSARVRVEVEVANFYPEIAARLTRFVYKNTQSRIHVLVTHGFLRSLARLELEESAVGRFAAWDAAATSGNGSAAPGDARADQPGEDVTVGETPWPVVLGLAAAVLAGVAVAARLIRSA